MLYLFFVGSPRIGEIPGISKCFEDFVSQALGFLTRNCVAELRKYKKNSNLGSHSNCCDGHSSTKEYGK